MKRAGRVAATVAAALTLALAGVPAAGAHEEREVTLPDGSGSVPQYRAEEPDLLVCGSDRDAFAERVADFPADLRERNLDLFERCQRGGFRHLQAAIDRVSEPGATIAVLPGRYEERPSRTPPGQRCADLPAPDSGYGYQVLSYRQQRSCPHLQNLVAIAGIEDLQIEGTGRRPGDVVIDAGFARLNAIRADRADGIYLRNFTVQRTTFNSVYIIETDGFVIDDVVARWNDEYGFLTFAVDHGLYTGCEAYGNGDSGIYPGSASNINAGRGHDVPRYAVEIENCRSHHNLLGYSGTAGDSVWVHDNAFYANAAGAAMDSAFPDHPGMPQNHALFEENRIHGNNQNYFRYVRDGTCAKPSAERGYAEGVVCPATGVPVGAGVLTAGGNYNTFRDNRVYDQDRAAFMLAWVPAFIRGNSAPAQQFDTSHHNRYVGNHLGVTPRGERAPNGIDFWWDGQGAGNCWQPDHAGSTPVPLPECGSGPGPARYVAAPAKLATLTLCSEYDLRSGRVPAGCPWYGAQGWQRLDVQLASGSALLLAAFALVLHWRRLPRGWLARGGTAAGLAGAAASVAGAAASATPLPAASVALLGLWWLSSGTALRRGHPKLGWLTVTLGVVALANAVDKGIRLIPLLPLPPAWLQLFLVAVWLLAAATVLVPQYRRDDGAGQPTSEPAAPAGRR